MRAIQILTFVLGVAFFASHSGRADDQAEKQKKSGAMMARLAELTPEQFIRRFDKNRDGYLSKDEMPPRFSQMFDRIDQDGDGKLDKKEVGAFLDSLRSRLGKDAGGKGKPDTKSDKKGQDGAADTMVADWLRRLDSDKDGKISRAEAKGPLAQNFDRIDTNQDGYLDKTELRRVADRMAANQQGERGRAFEGNGPGAGSRLDFDALDSDADGRLTRDELKGSPLADQFDQIDTNKDGKIDRKEFDAYLRKKTEKAEKAEKKGP